MISAGVIEAILRLRDEFTAKLEVANNKLQATGQRAVQIGNQMKAAGGALTAGLTLPIVALGGAAITAFSNFEAGMNKVRALSGLDATSKAFTDLKDLALELGATTKFSASEAAGALGFLAMAGFTAAEQMKTLPGVLELAASASLDLGVAADITTNILTGYGRTVDQIGETNDVLVKAFTSANTNLQQLGQAFKFVGPVAKAAGIEFEESAAVLSLMGNAGIQATMAGTALRGAISRLLNPTKQVQEAIAEVGLVTKDSTGQLLPMADIIEQLGEKGADAAQIMKLFGLRAGPAMAGLVSQGSDAIRKLTDELRDSDGVAQAVSRTMLEGVAGSMIRLRSAAEGALIAMGEQLAPAFTALLEKGIALSNWVRTVLVPAFAALPTPVQQIIIGLLAIAAAIGPLLLISGALVAAWGSLALALGGLSISLAGVLAFLTGPVGITLAIVALVLSIEPLRRVVFALATIITNVLVAGFRLWLAWTMKVVDGVKMFFAKLIEGSAILQTFVRWVGVVGEFTGGLIGGLENVAKKTELWGKTIGELATIRLQKLQEKVDELTDALGPALLEGTIKELDKAMLDLGDAGGLTEEALLAIAERAIMLRDEGEELTDGLINIVNWFERTAAQAEAEAAALAASEAAAAAAAAATKQYSEALEELQAKLGGAGVFAALKLWQAALGETFDTTGLTRAEQDELNGILQDAIEKWEALGESVPENVRAAERATRDWLDTMREIQQLDLKDLGSVIDRGFDADGMAKFGVEAQKVGGILPTLGQLVGGADIGIEAGVSLGSQLTSSFKNTIKNGDLGNVVINAITGGGDIGAALGATIGNDLGSSLGDFISSEKGPFGGGQLGSAIGSVMGPLGALAGQFLGQGIGLAIKGIASLFGGRSVAKNIAITIERDWGGAISEGLAKAMEAQVKSGEFRDAQAAIFGNTASIIAEQGGVVAFGIQKSISKTRDLFSGLETGALTAEQFRRNFEPLFAEILPNAIDKFTGLAREDFRELISLSKKFGVESAAVADFIVSQSVAGSKALNTFLQSAASETRSGIEASATAAFAFFAEATANGMNMTEALSQMGPAFQTITDRMVAAGIDVPPAFRTIADAVGLVSDELSGPLVAGAVAAGDVLIALANIGQLDAKTFNQMGKSIVDAFDDLVEGGATGQAALLAMQGPIAQLIALQDDFGFTVDASTQMLIDQGREAGITGDQAKTAAELQIEATDRLTGALDILIQTLGGVGLEARQAAGEATTAFGGTATAAGGIGKALDRIDFRGFVKDAKGAARQAQEAMDRVSFGESPGGIKEIPIQLMIARRALSDFQRSALDSIGRTQMGVDQLSGAGPGRSSLFADAATAPVGLTVNQRSADTTPSEPGGAAARTGGGAPGGGDINLTIKIEGAVDPEGMVKITQEQIAPIFTRLVRENRDQIRTEMRDGLGIQEGS